MQLPLTQAPRKQGFHQRPKRPWPFPDSRSWRCMCVLTPPRLITLPSSTLTFHWETPALLLGGAGGPAGRAAQRVLRSHQRDDSLPTRGRPPSGDPVSLEGAQADGEGGVQAWAHTHVSAGVLSGSRTITHSIASAVGTGLPRTAVPAVGCPQEKRNHRKVPKPSGFQPSPCVCVSF